ncbi:MAG: ATP-binding cassette domain-containing protein [Opitutaceae bacterium]
MPGSGTDGCAMGDVVISISAVTKRFPGASAPALDGIRADILRGGVTGLVGPDGAGKTTLLRLIAGLLLPSDGRITVDGHDSVRDAESIRGMLGYMPQKFGLYEDLSVMENLTLYADLRGVVGQARKDSFKRLLAFTDLERFISRPAGKLSGGMKQKLGLACTLLGRPRVLLLDEPSVGVDPISRRELWKMVQELVDQGMAVVWSTSYLDEAELCAETLLMNQGKLLFAGKPSDLTARVRDRCYRIRAIAGDKREVLTRATSRDDVLDGVIQADAVRLVLHKDARVFEGEEVGAGGNSRLERVEPRFEDAFIDMLGGGHGGESVLARQLKPRALDGSVVIEAHDLTKKFGDFVATDRVTFEVRRGEVFGLLGPNGAGKSTTFKMMCGLLRATAGTARVMGLDLQKSAGRARQRLGYMAQKFSLYGNLSVVQNLQFFSGAYGLRGDRQRREIDQMVEVFGLGPHLTDRTDSLPLGFKQRLALACAVMHEPDILFLDEPTSGVDPVTRREFWTHINGVVRRGVTVMVTTHFMDEAEYCDRIGLIMRGRLIAVGRPDELKQMVVSERQPDPTMEDAFIGLVEGSGEG